MPNFCLLFVLVFLGNSSIFKPGTTLSEEEIVWSDHRRLSWDDFRGLPSDGGFTGAVTYSTIKVIPEVTGFWNNRVEVEVKATFRCDRSWAKDKARESEYLLNHEQRHFDIAEMYARKLRAALADYQITPGNYPRIKAQVIEQIFEEYVTHDELYDHQTVHGINRSIQQEWDEEIDMELGLSVPVVVDDN